jgi:rod shape determining protein RodA
MALSPIQKPQQASLSLAASLPIDPWLVAAPIGLLVCSLVTLHGAAGSSFTDKQAVYGVLGLVLMMLVCRFDYSRLREYRIGFYVILIVTNLAVYAFSENSGSQAVVTHRWIPLPGFDFQSSEFGKLLLILTLAAIVVDAGRQVSQRAVTFRILLLGLVPALIVIKEPDLGTGLVYVTIALSMLFFAGVSWRYLAALAAMFAVAATLVFAVAPAVGVHVLPSYENSRLTTFIDGVSHCPAPGKTIASQDAEAACYQEQQALIAIGAGQKTGQRGGATQSKFNFIPEAQDDFIFAVVAETYGFAGAAVVLSLFALLIWRALRIVTLAKNLFGTLVAGGIVSMLMFQIFLNVGMATGIMPVTGVPLPLISYGGSSVIVTLLAIGLLQSIHVHARMSGSARTRSVLV